MRRALSAKTGPTEAELSEEHLLASVTTIAFGALEQPSAERRDYMAHEVERLRNTSSAYTTAEGQAFAAAVGFVGSCSGSYHGTIWGPDRASVKAPQRGSRRNACQY